MLHGTEQGQFYSNVFNELKSHKYDIFICPAAIEDFVAERSRGKLSSAKELHLKLRPARKLLQEVRSRYPKLKIVAFKAETNKNKKQLIKIGKEFLRKNKFDIVVANDVSKYPAGSDSSEMFIVSAKKVVSVKGSKDKVAEKIVEEIARLRAQ